MFGDQSNTTSGGGDEKPAGENLAHAGPVCGFGRRAAHDCSHRATYDHNRIDCGLYVVRLGRGSMLDHS